jgi:N-acetylglutamate synthase-like GNAT family acetyltransferase
MRNIIPADEANQDSTPPAIEIRPLMAAEDATAFRTLNEEWITRYFALEEKDIETLGDPENTILRKGGQIFMVHLNAKPVGCVALIPIGGGVFELSKMAVSPECRGQGIGRRLIEFTIGQARMLGASSLFLGSSTKLPSAIHLYESVGFRHVRPESLPPVPYTRANIFMRLSLDPGK